MDKNVYTIEEVDELKAWAEQAAPVNHAGLRVS